MLPLTCRLCAGTARQIKYRRIDYKIIRIFKTGLSSSSDSPEVLTAELGQQTSPGRRGFGPKSSGHRSPGGGASIFSNKRLTLPFLALVAVFAAGLLFLLPGGLLQAQDATIEYAENGEDAVATFTAVDPEGATPISWSIAVAGTDHDGDDGPLTDADAVDAGDFTIDKDGMLKFTSPPDFENPSGEGAASNTYKVVVAASDAETGGETGYHKVTVTVTNVNEPGKVTLATSTDNGTPQYLVGATLTATASDGDITDATQNFTGDVANEVTGVTWRWYRGGTRIPDQNSNEYTLQPADADNPIRAVVYYIVTGNVDQEMAEETTDYPVLAARVGDTQLKFDPDAVSRTISEGAKGRNVGAPVTATGNHGTVRYTLSGTDSVRFEIDEKTGQITTDVDLNYEADANEVDNCTTTQNSCSVTVRATDSTGQPTSADLVNLDATVIITITDVDEKPAFDDTGSQTVGVPENSTDLFGNTTEGYSEDAVGEVTYTAMDPEGLTVNYSLTGPDASKFQISGSRPVLSFVSKPDFEAKASADRDNVYMVTVRASVDGDTGERMVRVTVGDVDEGPDVSGSSTRNFAENGEDAVATFTAVDPEGATPISWSIAVAGTDHDGDDGPLTDADAVDAGDFTIDKDGMLKFTSPPDFENPSGEGAASNTYKVVVAASDAETGGETGYHKVTVTVTNVNEPGKVTLATSTDNGTPQYLVGATLTATASDGDITDATQNFTGDVANEVTGVTWRWYRGGTRIPDQNSNEYTLLLNDANNRIRVEVRYQVDGNTLQENVSLTTDYPVLAARVGDTQLKFDPDAVSRTISEGAKGRNVGAPVTATGNHGTVRYTLSGTDSVRFEIDEKTGQITTDVDLNYEADANEVDNCTTTQNSCSVTVRATDSTGQPTSADLANLDATVIITITDVDEKPAFDDTGSQTVGVPENSTDLFGNTTEGYSEDAVGEVTYTAMDPEGLTVNYSLTGPDASKFQISGSRPVLSFVSKPDFEAKASADRDNVYMVTVRASVDGDTGERMVRVTVGDVDEPPEIMERGLGISGPSSVNYAEGHMDDAVGMFTARGPMKDMARWTLEGADARYFMVGTARGAMTELMFRRAPDYEMPRGRAMSDTNTNTYMVTLKANDGTNMDTQDVTIMVTNVDEIEMVSGEASVSYAENDEDAVATYTASGPMADDAMWTLMGDDAGDFSINSAGVLSFNSSPNFEAPMDDGGDNTYMVSVKAEAGGEMAMQPVTVMVTNVKEDGTVTLSPMTPVVGTAVTASLTDPDGSVMDVTWVWETSSHMSTWAAGGGTAATSMDMMMSTYTPVMADDGMYLRATATYTDGYGADTAMNTTTGMVVSNYAPMFEAETATRKVAENTAAGMNIGAPVMATDADDDTLTHTLGGSDMASFDIDPATGQLMTKAMLDYEMPRGQAMSDDNTNDYMVTVTAMDDSGAPNNNDSIAVTIMVTNVNETGMLNGPGSATYMENSEDVTGLEYTTDGTLTPMWSLEGDDTDDFMLEGSGMSAMLKFTGSLDYENPSDADMDNMYMVTVVAAADGERKTQDVTVTVTNEEETGEVTLWAGAVALTMAPQVGETITGAVTDPDGSVMDESWQWSRTTTSDMMDSWMPISGATDAEYTVTAGDTDYYLRVMATYTDAAGTDMAMAYSLPTMMVVAEAGDTLLDRYDANKNGKIDRPEVFDAIRDFLFNETIERGDVVEVIRLYLFEE